MSQDLAPGPDPVDRPIEEPSRGPVDAVDPDDATVAEPFPTLRQRWSRATDRLLRRIADEPGMAVEALVSVASVGLVTALVLATLHPSDLFSNTTPTGGDMGSHVWGPRYLIDHLLPHFRLSGWTPDWYNGFPAYQFYMVVPSLFVVVLTVGLPWFLAVPAAVGGAALAFGGWAKERLYRFRFLLLGLGLAIVVLSLPLSYNRSFKLVTALGLLTLPLACWLLAKLSDLPFPVPPLAGVAAGIFLFNREPLHNNTGNIIGGNFQSTMAGEFAFSISLTFAVLYLGVAVRGLRTGKHRALAAVLFALAGLCHLIPAFFVLACTVALFLVHPDRPRFKWLASMVPVAGLLTAFWVLPFFWRRDYVNDMGWERLPSTTGEETNVWYYLLPQTLKYLFFAAALGAAWSIVRRYAVGLVLACAWMGVWFAFWILPQQRLWNAWFLPFMYLSVSLLAAIGVGETIRTVAAAAAGDARRAMRSVSVPAAAVVAAFTLVYVALPINTLFPSVVKQEAVVDQTTGISKTRRWIGPKHRFNPFKTTSTNPAAGWSATDYQGLEEKVAQPVGCDLAGSGVACTSGGWDEYRHLVQTMAGLGESRDPKLGCGRSFWEYDGDRIGGYGTPMALMMFPYFTDGCIGSQEGLYFESSATVPFHFIMQAELSAKPSQPQRDLTYPTFDIERGVQHLQMLGVKYYLAVTTTAVDQATRHKDLDEVAVSGPWHIYRVADAAPVSPLELEPVVAEGIGEGQHEWLPITSTWFNESDQLDVHLAIDGPDDWKRVEVDPVPHDWRRAVKWIRDQLGDTGGIDQVPELPARELPDTEVSNIEMGTDTISFDVTEPGVPVLVKTSYFPNWEVEGAEGPYRVSPNLMVVVPTDTHVDMRFGRTPIDLFAAALSLLGIAGVLWLARRPDIEIPPQKDPWLSRRLDRIVTITPRPAQPRRFPAPFAGPGTDGWLDDVGPVEAGHEHEAYARSRDPLDDDIWVSDGPAPVATPVAEPAPAPPAEPASPVHERSPVAPAEPATPIDRDVDLHDRPPGG